MMYLSLFIPYLDSQQGGNFILVIFLDLVDFFVQIGGNKESVVATGDVKVAIPSNGIACCL